jgi:hypothetical protein
VNELVLKTLTNIRRDIRKYLTDLSEGQYEVTEVNATYEKKINDVKIVITLKPNRQLNSLQDLIRL